MKPARLASLLALPLAAMAAQAPAAERPRLIVAISVDQFSADLFAQYRQHFDGGLQRLSEGVVFPNGYQGHNATETCPGHSTILTGSRPARTGIIANNWFNLGLTRDDKGVYCSEDPRVPGSSSRGGQYTVSSYHLRVPALGDHMKRANSASRVAVVAGKDRAAIMMGGYRPDERWWWDHDLKAFVNPGAPATPRSVAAANDGVKEALARARSARDLPRICEPHSRSVAVAGGGKPVGTGRFAREADDKNGFRASPELDRAVIDMGESLRREMKLGEGAATDLLILGLSATDYVGHTYGTQGSEMCIQLMALDEALGGFFRTLDATGIDYLVMLTADHGGHDIPERHRDHAAGDAVRVDPALNAGAMAKSLAARLKLGGEVLYGDGAFGDMYIDRKLTPAQRARVLREAVAAYKRHPQVAAVFTKAELTAAAGPSGPPDSWSLIQRAKASFDPERSGDFIVLLKPRVTPIFDTSRGYTSTHGSPWDYDRRVPILFWRKGMTSFEQSLAVETADILPTLAATIGVTIPIGSIDGRCLDLDEGPGSSCAR
ncbi:MAG TPA: alkaline phosphatase family protein [Allosphingosinicella sp.]|nr:alkaline phosphatase family protein [Allosphingosinicella sp.]